MKRSNAPIFWALFGAGGMLSALAGAALVIATGFLLPFGIGVRGSAFSYEAVLAFARHGVGKAALFVIIALFLWHAAHRLFHSLHDLGVHAGAGAKLVCYGTAMAGTLAAAALLWQVGF